MSKAATKMSSEVKEAKSLRTNEIVVNFMGGDSYKLNPLLTLKMIAASSIFGEASYYRKDVKDGTFSWEKEFSDEFSKLMFSCYDGKSTTEIFEEAIDKALEYDFKATLDFALELRKDYLMRLNPQVIMVRAAIHSGREAFTKANPGYFDKVNSQVMSRADEPASQLAYYIYLNKGEKSKLPNILKKSLAKKLSGFSKYQVNKYKNHEIGMINAVRITHAHSPVLDELMKTGAVQVPAESQTWEQYISANGSSKETWEYVVDNLFTSKVN